MGSCISSNTKTLALLVLPVGTPIPSSLAFIQQFLACPEGADSIGHRILRTIPGSLGAVNTVHAQMAVFRHQSWLTWMLAKKAIPRCCTVVQKAFQLSGNGDAGFS
jgi:hypothetical protein